MSNDPWISMVVSIWLNVCWFKYQKSQPERPCMPGDTEQKWHEACGFHHVGSLTSWQAVGPHFSASPLSKPASGTSSAVCCARDSTLTAARQLCNHWNQTEPRAAPWPPFLLHRKRRAPEEPARYRMTKLSIPIHSHPSLPMAIHGYRYPRLPHHLTSSEPQSTAPVWPAWFRWLHPATVESSAENRASVYAVLGHTSILFVSIPSGHCCDSCLCIRNFRRGLLSLSTWHTHTHTNIQIVARTVNMSECLQDIFILWYFDQADWWSPQIPHCLADSLPPPFGQNQPWSSWVPRFGLPSSVSCQIHSNTMTNKWQNMAKTYKDCENQ